MFLKKQLTGIPFQKPNVMEWSTLAHYVRCIIIWLALTGFALHFTQHNCH
jgi:hypothetical protein